MAFIIIGKVLLLLLIIVLLLVCLVLFYPVSYRVKMEKDMQNMHLQIRFRWFLGLIRGEYCLPEPKRIRVFLLWKEMYLQKQSEKSDSHSSAQKLKRQKTPRTNSNIFKEEKSSDAIASPNETVDSDISSNESSTPQGLFKKIKAKIHFFLDKFTIIKNNIKKYVSLLKEDETKLLFGSVFAEVKRLFKHLNPKKQRANLTIGTGSPDTTGYLYGVICMYSHLFGPNVMICPDFENKVFHGNLEMKGNITIFILVIIVLRLYTNKELFQFLDKVK